MADASGWMAGHLVNVDVVDCKVVEPQTHEKSLFLLGMQV
jgi:hypothetical protein